MDSLLVPSRKPHVGRVTAFLFETYLLINRYWKGEYEGKPTVWLILAQYIVLAMVIAFAYIGVGASDIPKDLTDVAYHISALATIRLAITVNTVPVFVAAFKNPRVTDIRGRGDDHIKYSSTSVYFAKFFVLNFFRVLFFIPFTAIVYPILSLRGGFDRALFFLVILMTQQYVAITIGLLLSAIFADAALSATVLGPVLIVNIILDGGIMNYIIPEGLRWLQYFAFSFYTQNALFLNEFEGITLQDGKTSDEVLKAFGYGQISKDASVGYLAIYGAICQILGIVVFHFSCAYHNRKYNKIT